MGLNRGESGRMPENRDFYDPPRRFGRPFLKTALGTPQFFFRFPNIIYRHNSWRYGRFGPFGPERPTLFVGLTAKEVQRPSRPRLPGQ